MKVARLLWACTLLAGCAGQLPVAIVAEHPSPSPGASTDQATQPSGAPQQTTAPTPGQVTIAGWLVDGNSNAIARGVIKIRSVDPAVPYVNEWSTTNSEFSFASVPAGINMEVSAEAVGKTITKTVKAGEGTNPLVLMFVDASQSPVPTPSAQSASAAPVAPQFVRVKGYLFGSSLCSSYPFKAKVTAISVDENVKFEAEAKVDYISYDFTAFPIGIKVKVIVEVDGCVSQSKEIVASQPDKYFDYFAAGDFNNFSPTPKPTSTATASAEPSATPSTYVPVASPSYSSGSNCTWVNGYYRKDGTYVRGHMRCYN